MHCFIFLALVALYIRAQSGQLERLSMNITTPNGSEFIFQHDLRDTRMYLTAKSPVEEGYAFTMVAHSRDNLLLRVDIVKWNPEGQADDHYDISDLKQPMVNQATKFVLASLERNAPDLFFMLKQIKSEGLRRTTRVRRELPDQIRKLFPPIPTIYERIIYSSLSPFFGKIIQRTPKNFELFPRPDKTQEWQKRYQRGKASMEKRAFQFDFAGHDQFARPSKMLANFGSDGMKITVEAHLPSVVDLYNDDSYI